MPDFIGKGDIVEYRGQRLKVVSDPYMFGGQPVVTCVTMAKKTADLRGGMFAVSSLALVKPIKEDYDA